MTRARDVAFGESLNTDEIATCDLIVLACQGLNRFRASFDYMAVKYVCSIEVDHLRSR